jgi:hypothetical protein
MFDLKFPTTKRIGIDLGTPYCAYLLAWFTSMPRKSASTGQAAN